MNTDNKKKIWVQTDLHQLFLKFSVIDFFFLIISFLYFNSMLVEKCRCILSRFEMMNKQPCWIHICVCVCFFIIIIISENNCVPSARVQITKLTMSWGCWEGLCWWKAGVYVDGSVNKGASANVVHVKKTNIFMMDFCIDIWQVFVVDADRLKQFTIK